jgi:hypothetical protein
MMKAMLGRPAMLFLLTIWCISTAASQELMPLAQWLKRPANQQEPSYLFIRYSGYYLSIINYTGAKFSKEEQDRFTWTSFTLAFAAAQVRHTKDGSRVPLKEYTEHVARDVERTADEYVKRMQRNYARSGNAITDDPLMVGDGHTCKGVAEELARK